MANNLITGNDFTISARVVPNMSDVNTEFKKISQTATINVNAKLNGESFKNVNKVVETYSDNLGKTYQKTTLLNKNNEVLASSITKLSEKFKPFNDNVEKANNNLNNASNSVDKASKSVKDVEKNLDKSATSAESANKSFNKTSNSVKKVGDNAKEASIKTKTLGQSFVDIVKKVSTFYLATVPINLLKDAFTEAIEVVKEFDDTLTEFKKVSDLSGESLNSYTQQLGELGQEVARTRSEMVAASTEFVKSGYSEEDAARLSRVSELYRNIADEAISSGESANFIISQMKAFGNETETFAEHTINAINNVSNNMSVSSSDISTALSKTSSAMGALGNDFNETIGLVTAGTEIMTGQASKVARG